MLVTGRTREETGRRCYGPQKKTRGEEKKSHENENQADRKSEAAIQVVFDNSPWSATRRVGG